jgi:molybdopterin biosynthesis enzyme MoaB
VIEKEAPGLVIKMMSDSIQKLESACLSRMVAGIKGRTLIINFPGSMGGVKDCFNSIQNLIDHAVNIINPSSN